MSAWAILAGIALASLVIVRLCGWTPDITFEPVEWCEVCGEPIREGWALHEVLAATGDPQERGGGSGMSAYWCSEHRPDDERAVPWRA